MNNYENDESEIYIDVCNVVCFGCISKIVERAGSDDKNSHHVKPRHRMHLLLPIPADVMVVDHVKKPWEN